MYKVIKDGISIALIDEPLFITCSDSGTFIRTDEKHARGISVYSTAYNLVGKEPMVGVDKEHTVHLVEIDTGEIIQECEDEISKLKHQIENLDEVAIALYESTLYMQNLIDENEEEFHHHIQYSPETGSHKKEDG